MGCWAACIATIVNYKKSSNITEEGVISASGITSGADINQTLSVLNDYSLSYKSTLSKIGWSRVKSCISADYPFIIGLESGGMGHMITGYGYSCTQGDPDSDTASRYVKAWDPVGSKISFAYYSTYVTCSGYTGQWVSTIYDN